MPLHSWHKPTTHTHTTIWSRGGSWPDPSTQQPDEDYSKTVQTGGWDFYAPEGTTEEGCGPETIEIVTGDYESEYTTDETDKWTKWSEQEISGGADDEPPYEKPKILTLYYIKHETSKTVVHEGLKYWACIPEGLLDDFEKFRQYLELGQPQRQPVGVSQTS